MPATGTTFTTESIDASGRSFTIDRDWSLIGGYHEEFVLRLTGQTVGGYGVLKNRMGLKTPSLDRAVRAGEIFVATGMLPCHQPEAL